MNDHRGFTVIEMIIGGAILLIITMIALSFFIFQSRHGGQLMKDTAVRENVSSALMMIKRDLMHAGSGLDKHPELSIWLGGLLADNYTELYVSYGGHLSPMAEPDGGISDYTDPNNIYSVYGSGAVFPVAVSPYAFTIAALPKDIYGVIFSNAGETDPGTGGPDPTRAQKFVAYSGDPSWPSGYPTNSFVPKYKFTTSAPSDVPQVGKDPVVCTPAIAYKLVTSKTDVGSEKGVADSQFPELRRNGVTILGGGRDKTLQITPPSGTSSAGGFRIRALFVDNSLAPAKETWVPITGASTAFPQGQTITNLRIVEVQIRYRTLKRNYTISGAGRKEAWTEEVTKTMSICPRELVVAGF